MSNTSPKEKADFDDNFQRQLTPRDGQDDKKLDTEFTKVPETKSTDLPWCSVFSTILRSVISLHMKKKFEYRVGIGTIFLVTAFITCLIAQRPLTALIFLQQAQMDVKETDFILTPKQDFSVLFNANTNLYNIDPFQK